MRYPSLDILRTIAIIVMVLVHFAGNLSGYKLPISGLGAPLFTFLSGVSYRLWINGLVTKGVRDEEISKISIRRGLFVFGVGFAFNILVWLPEDTFNWDVLTFIGSAILLLNLLRHQPLMIPVAIALTSIFISPVLRAITDYPAYWINYYFEADLTLSEVLIGYFVTGYFPIFPWITYSLTGFIVASMMFPEDQSEKPGVGKFLSFGGVLICCGVSLLVFGERFADPLQQYFFTGWAMFPASTEYVLITVGSAILLFCLLHQFVDLHPRLPEQKHRFQIFKVFSRYAFTIYLLHHIVHLWPLWIYGIAQGQEATEYWQKAMSVSVSLPLAVLFLALCYFILRRLDPEKRYGMEQWMRWLCG